MSNTVMVTGGSGYIGQHLVRQLAGEHKTVVSVYYRKLPESIDNVYPVCSDMSSAELMQAPLRGVDTVVHLAWEGGLAGPEGPYSWHPARPGKLPRNAQLVQNLVSAMERAGTKRIVFLSASGASGRSSASFLREKYLAEYLVLNSRVPEKLIVRSSVVWGGQNDDRFLRSIMRVMKFPVYPVPRVKEKIAPVHVRDVVQTLTKACTCKLSEAAMLLEVEGGEFYRVDELFRIVSERLVKKTQFPIGGIIGSSLLPLFERERGAGPQKLQHFLALSSKKPAQNVESSLADLLPTSPETFRDAIAKS